VDLARDIYTAVDFAPAILASFENSLAGERFPLRSHRPAGALALS
jgi:hypothetical protein